VSKTVQNTQAKYDPSYLILGLVIVNLLAGLGLFASLSSSRSAYELSAVTASRNMSEALEQSVNARAGAIDITLMAAVDALEDDLKRHGRLDATEVNSQLLRLQQRLTYVDGIRATDANGHVLYGYEVDPAAHSSWSGRDFLRP